MNFLVRIVTVSFMMAADLQAAREEKSYGKDFNLKSQEEKKYPETQKTVFMDV